MNDGLHVWYVGLEPYAERYTEVLTGWVRAAWEPRGHVITIPGDDPALTHIRTGAVLDSYRRGQWATAQTYQLLARLQDQWPDVIYFDDLFHPGIEAVFYALAQAPGLPQPRLYVRNWAQSVDEYDFTQAMRPWMRHYEAMVGSRVDGIFCASSTLADAWRLCDLPGRCHVVGLPFRPNTVRAYAAGLDVIPYWDRPATVVYSSRWDKEKQPHFFMDLAERMHRDHPDLTFMVCTGARELRSNSPSARERAYRLADRGVLQIHHSLSRQDYYQLVAQARVHFNCALQDYVSFALLEASALGTPTVAPAWRSFPEVYGAHARQHLYAAFQLDAAQELVEHWLYESISPEDSIRRPAAYHADTLARTWAIMQADAEEGR